MTTMLEIREFLAFECFRQRLLPADLAKRCGIHPATVNDLLEGTGTVDLNTLIAVCEALGLDIRLVPRLQKSALQKLIEARFAAAKDRA